MSLDYNRNKVSFILKAESGRTLYYKEVGLENYHSEMIERKRLTFYYFFKDLVSDFEEQMSPFGKKEGEGTKFFMEFNGRTINESQFDVVGIRKEELKRRRNEIELCFYFEKVQEEFLKTLNKEHVDYVLIEHGWR